MRVYLREEKYRNGNKKQKIRKKCRNGNKNQATEVKKPKREMASLRRITDNYPKTIITLDKYTEGSYDGIEVVNAVDWLLNT